MQYSFKLYSYYAINLDICQPIAIQNKRHHSALIELNRPKAINERIHCPCGSLLAKQYNTTMLLNYLLHSQKKPAEAGLVVSVTRYFLP